MWFESLFKLGAIDYMDVLSVHPYVRRGPTARGLESLTPSVRGVMWCHHRYSTLPENVEVSLPQLQAFAKQYSPTVTKEIWATEYGWNTNNDKARYSVAKYEQCPHSQACMHARPS
jgi:hypothetical protein